MMLAVSLVLGFSDRMKCDKGRGAKGKLCNLLLIHICYHLREPGDEVCACVCLQELTDMVFSRVGRTQLLLPATLVTLTP